MKKTPVFLSIFLLFITQVACYAQAKSPYTTLDSKNPIEFHENYLIYNKQKIDLNEKVFFIDGQLSDSLCQQHSFVFNSVNEATKHLSNGTEQKPMTLYIAPYVYWLDNPDDTAIRVPKNGHTPYALEINCDWLKFYGLNPNPENVVLACNRGQTIGAVGNFTLLKILGQGTSAENITFGNYCNIDLIYPLKPQLNRKKRAKAIVQAQLIHCNGDNIIARNTHFISRLNLCPFVGGKRVFFDNCHFECTDDALCGTAVYHNCTLEFYSSKPFYHTTGTGAIFLHCDIKCHTRGAQYFTKASGQLALIDTRILAPEVNYLGWQNVVPTKARNYQFNVSLNDTAIVVNPQENTINLAEHKLLTAYRFRYKNQTIYNIYNLLKGDDNWDPANMKKLVKQAERKNKTQYTDLPVQLKIKGSKNQIETGKDTLYLSSELFLFGNFPCKPEQINWKVINNNRDLVQLQPSANTLSCKVLPHNNTTKSSIVTIIAQTNTGLEAACQLTVLPKIQEAPDFTVKPNIIKDSVVKLQVNYTLNTNLTDQSQINWYRCTDSLGSNAIKVAVSRTNTPCKTYQLSPGDAGYYLKAEVLPQHECSYTGSPGWDIIYIPIPDNALHDTLVETDFRNIALENQFTIQPGFWTFTPLETTHNGKIIPVDSTKNAWYFGEGRNGAANQYGLLQTGRSAAMFYTPLGKNFSDMAVKLEVSPFKSAGQGFSIADLYMDVLIKFDAQTQTGYGLRFIRTTKYGNAVDCYFVDYKNGNVKQISQAISTSCYRTPCFIELKIVDNVLSAKAFTTANYYTKAYSNEVLPEIIFKTTIDSNSYGGFGVIYNGGASTMINKVELKW